MRAWAPAGRDDFDIYVISDLHLGGEPVSGGRGFRLMTQPKQLSTFIQFLASKPESVELIINGDFVDFLAERHEEAPHWRPLLTDDDLARSVFQRIVSRGAGDANRESSGDASVFDALRDFVAAGHRLSILLGNHDVELSYPSVRDALLKRIGGPIGFVYDNEALVRGDVVIEHGNRYDRYNQVDHDGLRRLRSVLSRRGRLPPRGSFEPSPGSRMVAEVMNPIKEEFPFVDLLKPETGAVTPTLLALRPSLRERVFDVMKALGPGVRRGVAADGDPKFAANISSTGVPTDFAGAMSGPRRDPITPTPQRRGTAEPTSPQEDSGGREPSPEAVVFGQRAADTMAKSVVPVHDFASSISSSGDGLDWLRSTLRLFIASGDAPVEQRLPTLLGALRLLEQDRSFSLDHETEKEYEEGARKLLGAGFRYVVFGHTHLPKHVRWHGLGEYLNCGTWADRIKLPTGIFDPDDANALNELRTFVADLREDGISRLLFRDYTYVYLQLRKEGSDWRCRSASLQRWLEARE